MPRTSSAAKQTEQLKYGKEKSISFTNIVCHNLMVDIADPLRCTLSQFHVALFDWEGGIDDKYLVLLPSGWVFLDPPLLIYK